MAEIRTKDMFIPEEKLRKWQNVIDLLSEIMGVSDAIITKADPPQLEMFMVGNSGAAKADAGLKVPLEGAFCEHVMKTKQSLHVPNALKTEKWQTEPATAVGLIFYLGFPLQWPNGDSFGTICVRDTEEQEYNQQQKEIIEQFKELIESHLEVIYQNQQLNASLEKGANIHKQLLPRKVPEIPNVALASYYQPALQLGGDFYNFIELNDLLLVYLVDAVGHSLDGAMLNIIIREAIMSFLRYSYNSEEILSPKELMQFIVSRYREENFAPDYLVGAIIGVLDLKEMKFTFSNAGIQIPPLVVDEQFFFEL